MRIIKIIISCCTIFIISCSNNKPIKQFELEGGALDMNVTVIITEDTSYALKYAKDNLDNTLTSDAFDGRGVTLETIDGKNIILWLPNANDKSIINHELLHASINILDWAGIQIKDSTEEILTYEMQYLSKQFYSQIDN